MRKMTEILAEMIFFGLLLMTALWDMRRKKIPNSLCLAMGAASLLRWPQMADMLAGALAVSVPMLAAAVIRPGALGGGDIKFAAACGMFLGWRKMLAAAGLAVLGGGLYAGILLAAGRAGRRDSFAFGPFLCAGAAAGYLFGDRILGWYLAVF